MLVLQTFINNVNLTLILMAGAVYDSRNIEQVELQIVLSNKIFLNLCYRQKMFFGYILFSTFEFKKMVFL
jgi:hypothetical protein